MCNGGRNCPGWGCSYCPGYGRRARNGRRTRYGGRARNRRRERGRQIDRKRGHNTGKLLVWVIVAGLHIESICPIGYRNRGAGPAATWINRVAHTAAISIDTPGPGIFRTSVNDNAGRITHFENDSPHLPAWIRVVGVRFDPEGAGDRVSRHVHRNDRSKATDQGFRASQRAHEIREVDTEIASVIINVIVGEIPGEIQVQVSAFTG